jgi:uncharacterized protein (TIGR00730 family)
MQYLKLAHWHISTLFMMKEKNIHVCVYCASSPDISTIYLDAATQLGQLLAENKITCINGAGKQGLMGAINNSILLHGGKVCGIIPQFMVENGWCHTELSEIIVTETMHERKAQMARSADAIIALPGGLGTLEELAEIITWKQLGLYKNPVIILNINGYYDSLLTFFETMMSEKFMSENYRNLWQVAGTLEEAMEMLKNIEEWNPNFSKYPKKEL